MSKKRKDPNRIKLPEIILFDGCARMGITAAGAMISSYLLLFYVKCGLELEKIALIFLLAKLFDAFNDVINAYIFDRIPKDKFGRLKAIGIICSVLFALNFAALWLGPYFNIGNKPAQYAIVWITYFLLGIAQDIVEIPYNMFCALQTEDNEQRGKVQPAKAIAQILGGVIITMIFPMIVTAVREQTGGDDLPAYLIAVVIVVFINCIITPISILAVKKRVNTVQSQEKISIKDILACLKIKEVLVTCACQIGVTGGISIVYSTIVFYSEYVMNQGQAITGMVNTLSGIGLGFWVILGPFLMKKIEKKTLVLAGLGFVISTYLLRMVMPTTVWWIYLMAGLSGLGSGALNVVLPVMDLESNEIVEHRLGRRAEGTLGAINTFFVKIGNTIAVILPAGILAAHGFDTDLASFSATNPEQYIQMYGGLYTPSEGATNAIIFCTHVLPALLYIVAFVLLLLRKHDKKQHAQMMQQLQERRALAETKQ